MNQQVWVGGKFLGRVSTLGGSWLRRDGPTIKVEGVRDRIATSISLAKVDSEKSRKRLSRCAELISAADRPGETKNRKRNEIELIRIDN